MSPKYTDENWEDVPSLLTMTETAELLRVHKNTVSKLINDGSLPFIFVGRRDKRIKKADLLKFIGEEVDDSEDD